MKKLLLFLVLILNLLFTGCDNNEGPFEYRYINGKRILLSDEEPAEGWVKNTKYNKYSSVVVSEVKYKDGLPSGEFRLFSLLGELVIDAKGQWIDEKIFDGTLHFGDKKFIQGKINISQNTVGEHGVSPIKSLTEARHMLIDGIESNDSYKLIVKNGKPFDGNFKDHTGEFTVKNGKYEGKQIMYYFNLKEEINYEDGIIKSKYTYKMPDGVILDKQLWKNKELSIREIYYPNGNIKAKDLIIKSYCKYYITYNEEGAIINTNVPTGKTIEEIADQLTTPITETKTDKLFNAEHYLSSLKDVTDDKVQYYPSGRVKVLPGYDGDYSFEDISLFPSISELIAEFEKEVKQFDKSNEDTNINDHLDSVETFIIAEKLNKNITLEDKKQIENFEKQAKPLYEEFYRKNSI